MSIICARRERISQVFTSGLENADTVRSHVFVPLRDETAGALSASSSDPSATLQPPSNTSLSDFPPYLPPDDIPESPLPAYSLTPDIDDSCETFTGTVQDPRNPPVCARAVSAPAAATSIPASGTTQLIF
jgi:hypothetical protein